MCPSGTLGQAGVDINDAINGVFLPKDSKYENLPAITHSTMHTDRYYNTINDRLEHAQPGTVGTELKKIGQELLNGTFPQ